MKLFIVEMTDYWERVSLPVVAESIEQALEKADLMAYEILDGAILLPILPIRQQEWLLKQKVNVYML